MEMGKLGLLLSLESALDALFESKHNLCRGSEEGGRHGR